MSLSHINEQGEASMVDIGGKNVTKRTAKAQAVVKMLPAALELILSDNMPKGDVFAAARLAGIMAAKKTFELIPLCHNIPVDFVEINFKVEEPDTLVILSHAGCEYKTGIEMEAMTAVFAAALTVYDMCKAVDKGIIITDVRLLEKRGGKSGPFGVL
ncbi:MAG: cyclic pyranopterin monophosphate synthase MoaC [Acutalibacteraceae bacterium]|jgi:cyclic pyranopterin phosphate synthase